MGNFIGSFIMKDLKDLSNRYKNYREDVKKRPKQNSWVTVIDDQTGEETKGRIIEYTPDRVTITRFHSFDASKIRIKK